MYKVVQSCQNCGAGLSINDMRQPNCPYCKTVYPHHSMAAQHAQVVGQVIGNMNAPQAPTGPPPGSASPYGAPPPGPGAPWGARAGGSWDPNQMVQQQMHQAQQLSKHVMRTVLIVFMGSFLLVLGIVAIVLLR